MFMLISKNKFKEMNKNISIDHLHQGIYLLSHKMLIVRFNSRTVSFKNFCANPLVPIVIQ